jgi:peroxin-6
MFTIGATNRPDLLDSALLRTGRFDKMIYLGVAKTVEEKVKIMQAQMRALVMSPDVNLDSIASQLPMNFTGADFSALTSEAYMIAVKERIDQVETEMREWKNEQSEMGENEELTFETYLKLKFVDDVKAQEKASTIEVADSHLRQALTQVTPSISLEELHKYEELRKKYSTEN